MIFLKKLFGRGKSAFMQETSDRILLDVARGLTPVRLDRVLRSAAAGDIRDQSRLSRELIEHNPAIAGAVSTRINAVLGCRRSFQPGDKTPAAAAAAAALTKEIEAAAGEDCFDDLLEDLMNALLPGFSISEILWENGGSIAGFRHIPQDHFTLTDGFVPKIITRDQPQGMLIPPQRIIYHRTRFHGSDPARGGLIRPLAWLHCFANLNEKNLLSFTERYGMPFLVVKADEATYQRERNNLKKLIRNFGSGGGGLFTRSVEHELLQAPNITGEAFFRLKESLDGAQEKLILGQTATGGDGGGLSNDGAQEKVRRDILEGDCRRLQRTINAQLCVPWTLFNFGASVAPPRLVIDCAAPEDLEASSRVVQALTTAGFVPDVQEMSQRFGMKLTYSPPQTAPTPGYGFVPEPDAAIADMDDTLNLKSKYDAMGVAIRAGLLTATPEIEEQTRRELGLPEVSDAVRKAWAATGGIRQPITLKTAEAAAVNDALDVAEHGPDGGENERAFSDAVSASSGLVASLAEWLGPLQDRATAVADASDEDFDALLRQSTEAVPGGSAAAEALMVRDMEAQHGDN